MRQFIVKYFAQYHVGKIAGKQFRPPRASTPIACSMLLWWTAEMLQLHILQAVTLILIGIFALISFVYLPYIAPAKWHELDDWQKWERGKYKVTFLTEEQKEEWMELDDTVGWSEKYHKWLNWLPIMLPLFIFIINLVIFFIKYDYISITI